MSKKNHLQVLDCTIRDGGYVNNWDFSDVVVREVYRACSKGGIDFVELGFRGTEKYFSRDVFGPWRFSDDEKIREVTTGIEGPKISIMADYAKINLEDFCPCSESPVDLVRVAVHKNQVMESLKFLEKIREKGYAVSLQAMAYATYSSEEKRELIKALKDSQLDYVYVADSYGSMLPEEVPDFLGELMRLKKTKIGFHPHNNMQMSFANTLAAIRCGVNIVDSSFYGAGRGSGNLPTEILLSYLEKKNPNRYNSIPILSVIDQFFVNLKEEKKWGYNVPYMLSGMFQLHPLYAKKLVELREYTVEDIWKVLSYIQDKSPIGYSQELLDNILKEGLLGRFSKKGISKSSAKAPSAKKKEKVPYINRHKNKDFLILANGPSLKKYRKRIQRFIDKYKPVVIGANFIGDLFVPDYHAFSNTRRFINYINDVNSKSKLLIGQHIPDDVIREHTKRKNERIYYKDALHDFDIKDGVVQANCQTVSVLLLAVAISMGAKRVFSAGMDGYQGLEAKKQMHFYEEADERTDQKLIIDRHRWCQFYIKQIDQCLDKQGKEGVIILTPTSYKGFYKSIENYI